MNLNILDLEANNLYPYEDTIWVIVVKKKDRVLRVHPYLQKNAKELILNFIFEGDEIPIIAGHNLLGFDSWVMWKDLGLDFRVGPDLLCGKKVKYFDTLFASQFFFPDRPEGHSLKAHGLRIGDEKIDYRQLLIEKGLLPPKSEPGAEFGFWTEDMDIYCEKDCVVCEHIFHEFYQQMLDENCEDAFRLGQKDFYLMNAQSFTGFKFDIEYGKELEQRILGMMEEIRQEVEPDLPKRGLKKAEEAFYTIPAKPYKQDGSFSSHMEKFIEKHKAEVIGDRILVDGIEYDIEPGDILHFQIPMSIDDQKDLKEYFLENGWKPTLWNYKKDAKGKFMRDDKKQLIKTSPKIQENGKICENLLELQGELPSKIVKYLSLKNRLGTLQGWLKDPRLQWDGRINGGFSGYAATHRLKHTKIVNVPKAQDDVLLGKEFRSLWTVEKGNKLVSTDQAALEARCQATFTFKYDGGENARDLLEGDVHAKNCKAFYPEETKDFDINSPDFNKDDPGFKPYRSKSKNGGYACIYGCSGKKLASTLGLPLSKGETLLEAFWEANPALKELKEKLTIFWKVEGCKRWILGIDKRRLYSRSEHSILNLLFQSTGAIIMQYALALFDMKMGGLKIDKLGRPYYSYKKYIVKRVIFNHDEAGVEVSEPIAEEVGKIMEWCMAEAGIRLKLNVPLIGESKIGNNWSETH